MFHVIRYSAQVIQQELHLPKRKRTKTKKQMRNSAVKPMGNLPQKINFAFVFDPFH